MDEIYRVLKPGGRLADAVTLVAVDGPLLVKVIGMVTAAPAVAVGGTVAVTDRSADVVTVVVPLMLLLPGLGSPVLDDTVALKATLPDAGAV